MLLQLVEANQGPCNPDDMQAVLKKDAGTLKKENEKKMNVNCDVVVDRFYIALFSAFEQTT